MSNTINISETQTLADYCLCKLEIHYNGETTFRKGWWHVIIRYPVQYQNKPYHAETGPDLQSCIDKCNSAIKQYFKLNP